MSLPNFSLAAIKNSLDEVRAQVYPRNETERKARKLSMLFIAKFNQIIVK